MKKIINRNAFQILIALSMLLVSCDVKSSDTLIEVNVKNYGVKGDGSTDDTEKLQNAINKITGKGERVVIPIGTYSITSINIPSNCIIVGYGATLRLIDKGLKPVDFDNMEGSTLPPGILIKGVSNVQINGLKIDGNSNVKSPRISYRHCFLLYDCTKIKLIDCEASNFEGWGFGVSSSGTHDETNPFNANLHTKYILLENCYAHNGICPKDSKVYSWQFEIRFSEFVDVMNCRSENGQQSLFRTHHANHIHFSNCKAKTIFNGYTGECFDIYKSGDVQMDSKCHAENLDSDGGNGTGYFIYQNSGVKLSDCTAHVDGYAVRVKHIHKEDKHVCDDITIEDNILYGSLGILLNFGKNIHVENNVIAGRIYISKNPNFSNDSITTSDIDIKNNSIVLPQTRIPKGFDALISCSYLPGIMLVNNKLTGDGTVPGIKVANIPGDLNILDNQIVNVLNGIELTNKLASVYVMRNRISNKVNVPSKIGIYSDQFADIEAIEADDNLIKDVNIGILLDGKILTVKIKRNSVISTEKSIVVVNDTKAIITDNEITH